LGIVYNGGAREYVGVVEDVTVQVQVVEGLGGEHHGHVVSFVQQGHRLQEEIALDGLQEPILKASWLAGGEQVVKQA